MVVMFCHAAGWPDFQAASRSVDLFLTKTILKFDDSSNAE